MNKKKILIIAFLLFFCVLVSYYTLDTKNDKNSEVKVTVLSENEFAETITLTGRLSYAKEQNIYFDKTIGSIKELHFKEGDVVKEGDLLFSYDSDQLELEKKQIEISIEENYYRINQINEQIERFYQKEKALKENELEKIDELQLKEELEQLNLSKRMEDLALRRNLLNENSIEESIENLNVYSEIDGEVLSINHANAKDTIIDNSYITLVKPDNYIIKGSVSEYEVLSVKEEQPVEITSEVLPDENWQGKVKNVGEVPENNEDLTEQYEGLVRYPITVSLSSKNVKIKPGFNMIMNIETNRKVVNSIPIDAVRQEEEKYLVYLVVDGKIKKKEVKIGVSNEKNIEIISGIDENDKIVVGGKNFDSGAEVEIKNDSLE